MNADTLQAIIETAVKDLRSDELARLSPTGLTLLLVQRGIDNGPELQSAVKAWLKRGTALADKRYYAYANAAKPFKYESEIRVYKCRTCRGNGYIVADLDREVCAVCEGAGSVDHEVIPRGIDPKAGTIARGEFRGIPALPKLIHRKDCLWHKGSEYQERECSCGLTEMPVNGISFRFPATDSGRPLWVMADRKAPLTPSKRRKAMQTQRKRANKAR